MPLETESPVQYIPDDEGVNTGVPQGCVLDLHLNQAQHHKNGFPTTLQWLVWSLAVMTWLT